MIDKLWVMWIDAAKSRHVIGTLRRGAGAYHFAYEPELPPSFQLLPEFPEPRGAYASSYLFPTFAERLPSPRRPDYRELMEEWGVESTDDPLEALARSGGLLVTDSLELAEWRSEADPLTTPLRVRVAGTRYHEGADGAQSGQQVTFVREPENAHDPAATLLLLEDGRRLGYVPRPYTGLVACALDAGATLSGTVERRLGVANSYVRVVVRLARAERDGAPARAAHP